jgi:hypothetical protein
VSNPASSSGEAPANLTFGGKPIDSRGGFSPTQRCFSARDSRNDGPVFPILASGAPAFTTSPTKRNAPRVQVHIEREDMRPCESERAGGAGSWPSHHAAQESDRRFVHDSLLEGGVRCELVSKVSFIRRSDEFLESIKKGDRNVEPRL